MGLTMKTPIMYGYEDVDIGMSYMHGNNGRICPTNMNMHIPDHDVIVMV